MALCTAAVAHYLHSFLVNGLCNLSYIREDVEDLARTSLDRVREELKDAIDAASVVERAKKKLEDKHKAINERLTQFKRTWFFPLLFTVHCLVGIALGALMSGFVVLVWAYAAWQ